MNWHKSLIVSVAAVLAAALICVTVFARHAGVIEHDVPTVTVSEAVTQPVTEDTTAVTQDKTETPAETERPSASNGEAESSAADTTAKSTTAKAGTTTQKTGGTTTQKTGGTTQTGAAQTTTQTTAKATVTEKETACYLTIDCTAADGGYLLKNCRVTYQEGDSAYDILKRGCEANGISLNAKNTGYGIYVSGINGLNEKDVGDNSGWLYYVNATLPNKASSKYKVKAGDTVKFYYTVNFSTGN